MEPEWTLGIAFVTGKRGPDLCPPAERIAALERGEAGSP
jgi:hypothetical protein